MRVSILHVRGILYEDNGTAPTATRCGIRRCRIPFLQELGTYIKAPRIFSFSTSRLSCCVLEEASQPRPHSVHHTPGGVPY
jgi:hypothetical protein